MLSEAQQDKIESLVWRVPGEATKYSTEEVMKAIRKYINDVEYKDYEYDLGIGTDSQMIGAKFQFISVISVHRVGKGGLYYYNKFTHPRSKFPVESQKMRMFEEVGRSIELAFSLKEAIKFDPVVHIDASPAKKKEEFTSKFSDQLRGYVHSCGFECNLKPESYVAHAIADRHTKRKTRKRRGQQRKRQQK